MSGKFQKATRRKIRLRMAIDGPSGSGKTYTALRFAFALGGRVAVIDTESCSASKYQGDAPDGVPFDFDVLELTTYAPTTYTSAIETAGREGYDVLIIDSLSHAWAGKDGALEIKDSQGGNSFTAWKNVTPMHNRMIDAILQSPCHIFATMRSKTEYVLEPDDKGKMVPRKIGMAPIQRAGMEYEFDIYGSMDWSHLFTVTKSRCSAVADIVIPKPGPAFIDTVRAWMETGQASEAPTGARRTIGEEQIGRLKSLVSQLKIGKPALKTALEKFGVAEIDDLSTTDADEIEKKLNARLTAASNANATANASNPVVSQ